MLEELEYYSDQAHVGTTSEEKKQLEIWSLKTNPPSDKKCMYEVGNSSNCNN